ncbi:thioesterase family protein [Rhodoligotrophos defluvii]|uniref:thioesterase family protein n=1 Tax=Rhodoligotrophos defluvii TaxID=2561934 RepID=UPI001485AA05|nr:thioesterase family protein [Rhodoligotrophos defluvii]
MSEYLQPITVVSTIDPTWRDYNGHVNYAAYAMAADPAIDAVYAAVGMDLDYRRTNGRSDYVVESRFFYLREIRRGTGIEVRARLADFDRIRTHIFCEIVEHDSGVLAATAHIISIHVNSAKARSAEFPAFALAGFERLKAEHDRLPLSDYFDGSVVLRRRLGPAGRR